MPTITLRLPSTWEAIKKISLPAIKTKIGDGNEQIVIEGVRAGVEEWNMRSPLLLPEIAQAKLEQIRIFSGISHFYWSPDNELTIPSKLFTCEGWTHTWLSVTYSQIEATFKQVV